MRAGGGEGMEKKNRWGRGNVCGCWYGAQSCFVHHLLSSRTQPPFRCNTWPIFGFLLLPPFLPLQMRASPLHLPLPSPLSSSPLPLVLLLVDRQPPPLQSSFLLFDLLTPGQASPTVRQHSDVVCLDGPLSSLCSRRWLEQFCERYPRF